MVTIDDAIQKLALAETDLHEYKVPASCIRLNSNGLLAEGELFRLDSRGLERLCQRVGAPGKYVASLDRGISTSVLQYHLDRGDLGGDPGNGPVTFLTRGGRFVAFVRPDLARLSAEQVLKAVLGGIGPASSDLLVASLNISDEAFQLDLLGEEMAEEVVPGDVIQAGLRIGHSMIGESATRIESYALRLVCRNGLVHRDCATSRAVRTRRLPASHPEAMELQIRQVQRIAGQAWERLKDKLQAIRALRLEQIDVGAFLERWLQRVRLSARTLMPSLRQALEQESGEQNVYTAVNTLTRVATHFPDVPARQRQVLSRLAGLIAFRNIHICPRCFSMLTEPHSELPGPI